MSEAGWGGADGRNVSKLPRWAPEELPPSPGSQVHIDLWAKNIIFS